MTQTFVLLEVSPGLFEDVRVELAAAGYGHAFDRVDGRDVVDMHGIALVARSTNRPPTSDAETWQLIRDEVGFGITNVADVDGSLRDRCVDLLDAHAERLAELRVVLDDPSAMRGASGESSWVDRLHRAAWATVGAKAKCT